MVKLNKKKYNQIIENFENKDRRISKKSDTIIDSGKKLMNEFSNLKKDMLTEHFVSIPGGGGDPFKKITDFFKQIENFFKKIKEAFTFTQKKMFAIIITIVLPFFGQLIARIVYLNGSFDMPWLFFFSIPPLSIIPAILMMFGIIKKGKGGKPYDFLIFVPIIVSILSDIFLKKYFLPYKVPFVKMILIILSTYIVYWYKSKKICSKSSAPVSKILENTLATNVLIGVMAIVLKFIPVIGIGITIISKLIPFSNYIINAFSIFMVYIVMNMINGSSKDYCKKGSSIGIILALIVLNIFLGFAKK